MLWTIRFSGTSGEPNEEYQQTVLVECISFCSVNISQRHEFERMEINIFKKWQIFLNDNVQNIDFYISLQQWRMVVLMKYKNVSQEFGAKP